MQNDDMHNDVILMSVRTLLSTVLRMACPIWMYVIDRDSDEADPLKICWYLEGECGDSVGFRVFLIKSDLSLWLGITV